MNDLEMTKLCAEAMGLTHAKLKFQPRLQLWVETDEFKHDLYDPLRDDTQAMALVKRFELAVYRYSAKWAAEYRGTYSDNPDLNRAIVECVAKMRATESKHSAGSPDKEKAK